ncbi:MAG: BatA domain-containing protein [Verrucomicrobia bacterium]|nr:BatA domain-containing protein [Verrucomicrobiota bacterium]
MLIAVSYLNAPFLYVLGAVSAPIIIHLLFKKRRKKIVFSTLRFLKIATRENARRNRIKQIILLAMRVLIVGLIVFAFARPFLRDEALAGIGPGAQEVVFLVDRSYSMGAESELGGTKIEHGRAYAIERIKELKPGDTAAVIAFDETPELVQAMTDDFGAVLAAVERITPGTRTTNFGTAIAAAQAAFDWDGARAGHARQKAMFLVSDLQMGGLGMLGDVRLRRGVVLEIPDLTHAPANVAVTKLEAVGRFLQSGAPVTVQAQVRNYGTAPCSVLATLEAGGGVAGKQRVSLGPGGTTTVEFEHTFADPGLYGIGVSLDVDDALGTDNAAYAVLDVRRALHVLLVNGTPSQIAYFRETHYIEVALNPFRLGEEPGTTMFAPQVISPGELSAPALEGQDAVVLANVDFFDEGTVALLERFVRDGGGLLVFTGDKASIIQYNRDLYKDGEGLLPAALEPAAGTLVDASVFWEITSFDEKHPVFQPFLDPAAGDLSVPRFQRIHRLGAFDEGKARALAFLNDGRPILVEKQFGAGRVLLVPTSGDEAWTDLPKRKVYLPLLHRMAGYLCGVTDTAAAEHSYFVGEPVALPEGLAKVFDPGGRVLELADRSALRETEAPGLYTLLFDDGRANALAITVNPVESDLRACSVVEFRKILSGETDGPARAGLGDEDAADRDEIWQYLFIGLLAIMLSETWLANRTHV